MSTKLENVRFAHYPEKVDGTKCNGFTIAYVRQGKHVRYGYSLACAPDQFSKQVGREFSTATLEREYTKLLGMPEDVSCRSTELRAGVLHVGEIAETYAINAMMADQVVDKLNAEDFKHSAIANVLIGQIYNEVIAASGF